MPIKKIKAQSPDPYLGKIKGDTELARLAHLNHLVDQINAQGTGGGSLTINNIPNITNLNIGPVLSETSSEGTLSLTIDPYPGYRVYRAKLRSNTFDWPGYGYLYNWYAVDDARGLANPDGGTGLTAPNEWRVPSDTDWNTLIAFAGGSSVAGGKLKSTLTSTAYPFYGWLNFSGTNNYNFNALAGGLRSFDGEQYFNIGYIGLFWTSSVITPSTSFAFEIGSFSSPYNVQLSEKDNKQGFSIRLVREATAGELLLNDGDTSDTSSLDPYTGNDGTVYVTVKIGTQIWLAQNLRETLYNNTDAIFNASILPGGDPLIDTWAAKGNIGEGAWTLYGFCGATGTAVSCRSPYLPEIVEIIYTDVLENTLGTSVNWESILDGNNSVYRAMLSTNRNWYPTHIKLTPGYDVSDYDNSIPTLVQKNLIVKRAVAGEPNIEFFPVTIDSNGTLTIEHLNNYNDLLGSPDSSVYIEILEYIPEDYYSSMSVGIGISNL